MSDLLRQISFAIGSGSPCHMSWPNRLNPMDAAMPIAQRYRSVLEAYDQYVEPMNEMMDSGLAGNFYPFLEQAERALDRL